MIREVVKIDEQLCNGCGLCVPGCHEGALQIIDGKARLISDLMCDGLGACLGHCSRNAITIEKREAEDYDEAQVMEKMVEKGKNTVIAHLIHLKDHQETGFVKQGVTYLRANEDKLSFSLAEVIQAIHNEASFNHHEAPGHGCPGSTPREISREHQAFTPVVPVGSSELKQWPVQLHLINPQATGFRNTDLLVAADCTAYALGDFHNSYLKDKSLVIACPKLDSNQESYLNKITALIDYAHINTITVLIMQVPCCGGLLRTVQQALSAAQRRVPVKLLVVSVEGEIVKEEWV
jgi:NAD-dependent dihydropyrimidine dehydrogenase PreA subunit